MKWAVIEHNVVTNVMQWEGTKVELLEFIPNSTDAVQINDDIPCGPGWEYNGTSFIDPNAPPPPSKLDLYRAELAQLISVYLADRDKLAQDFSNASLADGPNEVVKKQMIYEEYQDRKAQHATDTEQLRVKYDI